MAESPVTRIVNKFNQLFGIKPSEIPIPKQDIEEAVTFLKTLLAP